VGRPAGMLRTLTHPLPKALIHLNNQIVPTSSWPKILKSLSLWERVRVRAWRRNKPNHEMREMSSLEANSSLASNSSSN
jgi:hypothetical protein